MMALPRKAPRNGYSIIAKKAAANPTLFQDPIVLKARFAKKPPKNFPSPKTEKIHTDMTNKASPRKNEKNSFSKDKKSVKKTATMNESRAKVKISKKLLKDAPPPQRACGEPATRAETSHDKTSAIKIHKIQ